MGQEIERKFLPVGEQWRLSGEGVLYRQGYICSGPVTVRIRTAGDKGFLTVKGPTQGLARAEFEYAVPFSDAQIMLETLAEKPLIEKRRYSIPYAGLIWEVDEFFGFNQGLIVAEVELESEDQPFVKPPWIGREVTDDPRYRNSALVKFPYTLWK